MAYTIVIASRYLIPLFLYLFLSCSIYALFVGDVRKQSGAAALQMVFLFLMQFTAWLTIVIRTQQSKYLLFYAFLQILTLALPVLAWFIYPGISRIVMNHMCMLFSAGLIVLTRLDLTKAIKQLIIAGASFVVFLIVPWILRKCRFLEKLGWIYAGIGIVLLAAVLVLAQTSYGAKLSLMGIQPSEAIKITFVFFMAALLRNGADFSKVVQATIVAGLHVGILVLSRDLGSAVIFFAAYLVMIYVASKNVGYLALGLGGGSVGAVIAYHLFGHVRQRVTAWKDPMAVYQNEGYQIVQSLFAIGTGGWFGMGLCQGSPEKIPVVKNDFIFSAICEELGCIFAICLILVCMNFFLMIVNIALKIKKPFYKLIALGLGTEYAFQVFLTIGGATKFIPMTGVTLPLVSYGGSSVASTVLMLAIIQGLYILREDEDEEIERYRRKEAAQRAQEASEAQGSGDF